MGRGGQPETFVYNGQSWDVSEARRIVVGRRPGVLVIDETLARESRASDLDVNREWALAHADLSEPVIVLPLPETSEDGVRMFGPDAGDLVVDGWHRIVRAVHERRETVPAHFLTPVDERRCRQSDDLDSLAPHTAWHALRAIASTG